MTWTVKIRGDARALIAAEYECPIHGRFEITAPRDDVPDDLACPVESGLQGFVDCNDVVECGLAAGNGHRHLTDTICGLNSPWCFPSPARTRVQRVTAARRGKDPERPPLAVDWESLAYEARDPAEVQAAERKKTFEELRRRTKGLLR